jgi:hypothetical protein
MIPPSDVLAFAAPGFLPAGWRGVVLEREDEREVAFSIGVSDGTHTIELPLVLDPRAITAAWLALCATAWRLAREVEVAGEAPFLEPIGDADRLEHEAFEERERAKDGER